MQAFEFVESAANLGTDADIVRCKLEWEQYRLYQWAEQVGLEENPNHRLNWVLASDTLRQIEALLTSSKEWRERYKLDVAELRREASTPDAAMAPSQKSPFGFLVSKLRPSYSSTSSRILLESNSTLRRLEWAAVGRDKMNRVVDDIHYLNDCLNGLLEFADRTFITSALEALLRDVISRSHVTSELDVVKELLQSTSVASREAVASAASLKRIRLVLGLSKSPATAEVRQSNASSGMKLRLTYLKSAHLVRDPPEPSKRGREVAQYKSSVVLVEWRLLEKRLESQLKSRIDQLAILLGNTRNSSFHSLHCMGVLPKYKAYEAEDEAYVRYGLIFELGKIQLGSPSVRCSAPITLADLYQATRRPSLDERLMMALSLAETLLQLHTTGWLHKGIRPQNVLFFDMKDGEWQGGPARGPYLASYEYARLSSDQTETILTDPETDLYRHPLAQGPARSEFRRAFDLFALGCLLMEIALWKSLHDILKQAAIQIQRLDIDAKSYLRHQGPEESSDWAQINEAKSRILNDKEVGTCL
ncbi:hypothetical protein MMC21_004408 [Puttea exsequens]|nr:hypothetical protein [Puttea exsequens]